jgi:hypothetical protein
MRTTITLDDKTHAFANYYADARGLTLSAAIDELIRKAQTPPEIQFSPNGFPMFPPTGRTVTDETVKKLAEEEYDPEKFA